MEILTRYWCDLSDTARVVIVTDEKSITLATEIKNGIQNDSEIMIFEKTHEILHDLKNLSPEDLVIALFSINKYMSGGANAVFSPFSKPRGIAAKYVFIRLDITSESLMEGLSTPKELVYNKINDLNNYDMGSYLRVTNPAGTDLTLRIFPFSTYDYEISTPGGMAFLPPSETSCEVMHGTANGVIVVDVTIGQLYYYGELLGYFGLVNDRVVFTVNDGIVTDITGGSMALELKEKLFMLPNDCRVLVELGHGLSKMTPTGLIGVDESIIDTCHFGIGDRDSGVHLDVVVSTPNIISINGT